MTASILLHRRALGNQLGVAMLFLSVGGALIGGGVLLLGGLWGTVGGILLILAGVPFVLTVLVRFHGWRSLFWKETLEISADRVAVARTTPEIPDFAVDWSEVSALGLYAGTAYNATDGVLLCAHYPDRPPRVVRLPRRPEVLAAIGTATPPGWSNEPVPDWPVRIARPGTPPQQVPGPGPSAFAVMRLMTRSNRLQIIAGLVLALGIGALPWLLLLGGRDTTALVVVGIVLSPLLLLAVYGMFALPTAVAQTWLTLDRDGVVHEGVNETTRCEWAQLARAWLETSHVDSVQVGMRRRDDVTLRLSLKGGRSLSLDLGDQPVLVPSVKAAFERFAGPVWLGVRDNGRDRLTGFRR
ncbi:hypothetical protein [Amycolatopsis orientalis]|uniref:hypothetical protein n=1 Tax=Amycolatopsis orientalis TaxID=31958 RepID=UPI00056D4D36|nr:hypothetical protein [Amycolatopsis orientalis]